MPRLEAMRMCILFVEDEDLIRRIIADELDFHGFDVCEAHTGDHAASLIETSPKVFNLLITDIHMPGQRNGIEVARLMRLYHPNVPIIYTTGRPDMFALVGPLGAREVLLAKPYSSVHLVQTVRALLAR
jgi:DNA-binding response OmpR family regulator